MFLRNKITQLAKSVLIKTPKKVWRFGEYLSEFKKFKSLHKREMAVEFSDAYPCLSDKLSTTPFDQHYTYHPAWAARILAKTKPAEHIDISSILHFGTILSAFIPVKFFDYRPAHLNLKDYQSSFADLKKLPFASESVNSLSCMHTIEHIGLGRYGDELDPEGDIKGIEELKRVLADGGNLLFVTPVGRSRVEFNAHRIYSFEQIVQYFSPLILNEFSLIPDSGGIIENADPGLVAQQQYACGCFWFKK